MTIQFITQKSLYWLIVVNLFRCSAIIIIYSVMQLPLEIYEWLVSSGIVSNTGEQDDKGSITLPQGTASNFDNGFLVGEIIRKLTTDAGRKVPSALATVKADPSKNAKLTNWNFIWLAFDAIGLKLDTRIKELILQGQQALIVEVVRQLYERDEHRPAPGKMTVRMRSAGRQKGHAQAVDIKKINLSKDPQESESSLQFLMLLLKASLGMNLQEILGLFTNQNKYLAHIIVKGVAQSFDSIILFYSLLNKHSSKLKAFYEQDSRDAQACLYALKPGFISKNQKVAELTLQLFGKIGNIYQWFVGQEGKCAGTLLLGLKRHPPLRELYWHLLLQIIQGQQIDFFAKNFIGSFQNQQEQIQITGFLVKFIAQSWLGQKLTNMGVVATWIQAALKLPETNLQAQIICFRFVGELMLFLPEVVEQNEQSAQVFERKWYKRTLPQFTTLLNELMELLQKLGESRSSMARRVFQAIVGVTRNVGNGDKRDYLVENFLPLVPRFPSIPAEILIQHLRHSPLSHSEYLLVCETLQASNSVATAISIGSFLKTLFLQNPLLNFNLGRLLKEVAEKMMEQKETGVPFLEKLLQEVLQLYGTLQVKYKPKPKQQQSMYFGRKGSPEKVSKQEEQDIIIKQKWKQILLGLILTFLDLFVSQQNEDLKEMLKDKLLEGNATIRKYNHKVGSKPIQDILNKRFGISKEEQVNHAEQFTRKVSVELDESNTQKSKAASSYQLVGQRLKGPQNLTKQFQLMIERRKQEEEQRKALELKKHLLQQKKRLSVKKELQISNLLRGQIGEAQLRQLGFLDRLMQEPKGQQVVSLDELQAREVDAVQAVFKNYHKVLRHLFLTYTWTMYNSHSNQKFEDNVQRKELLNVVELGRMLKDYRLAFLTSQPQLCTLVRDINVKLLGRKEVVNQLDYTGFEQFVIQFCALFMPRNRNRTIFTPDGPIVTIHDFSKEPLYVLVKEFFLHLKNAFLARGDKVAVFEDVSDVLLTKQQAYQVEIFNKKLQTQPNYILPKGYKKLAQHSVHFQHSLSPNIGGIPQGYAIVIEILDSIFQQQFVTHIIEDIAVKKINYKVKPTSIGLSGFLKERAMSTVIQRKATLMSIEEIKELKLRSASRGALLPTPPQEKVKPKRTISLAKLQELQKAKFQSLQRKARQKQEERQAQLQLQKDQERKRKIKTQKYLQQQKARAAQRKKKEQSQSAAQLKQFEQRQAMKRQNKQKFKAFHQNQLQKIKKVFQDAQERQRLKKQEQQQEKERQEEMKKRLRQKIQQQDKCMAQIYKQAQNNMRTLFQSEPIKRNLARFQPNLRAIFDFLLQNTFLSITEKRHNNQIIFDTWRYFISAFELTLIVNSKTTAHIFKTLTKDKIVPKQFNIGLNFEDFQQALLRITIKYKNIFNLVAEKIKDKQPSPQKNPAKQKQKKGKKIKEAKQQKSKSVEKQKNQFDPIQQINIRQLIKQGQNRQPANDFADLTNVTDKTLLGLIYYLKVPNSKHGQEKRFRDILLNKQQPFAHNAERLKEKLKQQYTLEVPPKQPKISKSPPPQPIPPQKLIN